MKRKVYFSLGLYAATSYYFLKHPEYLHSKKNKLKLPTKEFPRYIIAHRGGSMEAPENTLQAFRNAINQGTSILETDVRMTKNNVVLVCHDENFMRLSGNIQKVNELHVEELPEFLNHMPLHFSKNQFYKRKEEDQIRCSTLEEVFQNIPKEIVIQIDLKDKDHLAAREVLVRLIRKYDREQTTIIGSEREFVTSSLHQLAPEIPKFFSSEFGIKVTLAYFLGFLPFMKIPYDVFASPYLTRDYLNMKLTDAREKSWIFYPYIMLVTVINWAGNGMIEHLNKRGILTSYWVINDDDEIKSVIKNTKVQGIMTDRPASLRHILQEFQYQKEHENDSQQSSTLNTKF